MILYKLDDSGNFKEYGDFGESADSSKFSIFSISIFQFSIFY